MQTTNIYVLIDPETDEVRYVGKANNISERYKAHLNRARKHQTHKKNWIDGLRNKGLKPIIVVIDVVPANNWAFWEKYWIGQMKVWGFNLVNHTEGGDGCTFGNQTSFKRGSTPWNKGGHHSEQSRVKMKLSQKNKIIREKTKEKMSQSHKGKKPAYMINGIPEDVMIKMKPTQFKPKIIIQLTLNGNFVKEHPSIKDAAKSVNGYADGISKVCNGKWKYYKNYIWKIKLL